MAKKVNKVFLVGLVAAVGGIAVAGFGLVLLSHHTASYYLKRAEAEEARGDLQGALNDYGRAAFKEHGNKDIYIKIGDIYDRMVPIDQAYLGKAVGAWRTVMEMDPSYTPAIDRLLNERLDEMKAGSTDPASFTELRKLADAAVKADPENPKYQAILHIATVRQWVGGAALSDKQVADDIKALVQLAQKNPDEADAALWAAEGQFKQASNLLKDKPEQAHALLDQIAVRQQSIAKARPDNTAVQLRTFQILTGLMMVDDRADKKTAYQAMRGPAITAAAAHAKPEDELYDDTQVTYAMWLASQNAPRPQIEKVYRDWMAARPSDLQARNRLAEFLGADPKTRDDAIALLLSPVPEDHSLRGVKAAVARQSQRTSLIILNTLRIDQARATPASGRDAILARVEADLPKITPAGAADDYQTAKLRGKLLMLRKNPVEAIKSFERARTLLGRNFDGDLWANLEQAYIVTNQPGTAEQLLEQLIARMPTNSAARIQLAEMYLNTGQVDRAAAQLDRVDATKSNTPEIAAASARLRVAVLSRQNRLDDARKLLTKLPEQTKIDRIFKARVATEIGDAAEAQRLHLSILKDDPANSESVGAVVDAYLRQNNRAQAQQVVADALKAKPDDKGFKALADRLTASTPEELQKWLDQTIRQTSDPFLRDLRLAQVAMNSGKFDEAKQHLDAAEGVHPDDPRLMDVRLQWFVRQRMFDQAMPLVERAAAANADRMDGLSIRTNFALQRGDIASALKWGNQLVGKYGEFASNWLLLAQAQQAAGAPNDAIASYDNVLSRQPNNIDALRGKAACFESLGQFADEKTLIDTAARLAPNDANVRDQSLNFELHHGDPDKVIATCQELVQKDPANPAVYTAMAQAYQVAAQTKYRGDAAKARSYIEKSRDVLKDGMTRFASSPEHARFYQPLAQAYEALGDSASAEQVLHHFADLPSEKGNPQADRSLAMLYERTGRLKESEQMWRDAYDKSGKTVPAELDLAMFLVRRGRVDEALNTLQANAADPRVLNQRIETLMAAGRLDQARQIVDQALASNTSDSAVMYYRGVLELAQGNVRAAVDDLTALRNKNPQNLQVRLWLARALLRFGRQNDAIVELETALQRAPLNDAIRTELLGAYSAANPPHWVEFDRVVREAENNPTLAPDPKWHQLAAQSLARRGQFGPAVQEINAARKLAPNSFPIWQDQVSILSQAGDWKAVLNETDQQLAAGIKTGVLYAQRATARAGLKDKPGALQEFDAGIAVELAAKNPAGVTNLLRLMGQLVSPDEALARLDKFPAGAGRDLIAMELYGLKGDYTAQAQAAESALAHPDQLSTDQKAAALRTDAEAYLGLSQWEKARKAYDQLINLQPDNVLVLNNVAYLTATVLHDPHGAKQYSGKAYALVMRSGGMPDIQDTHGWVLTLCGGQDATTGLDILRNLVDADKTFTKARYHLAEAYLRKGDTNSAREQLAIVQDQMKQLQMNHQPVDSELQAGVSKALQEIEQKTGLKSSASSQ